MESLNRNIQTSSQESKVQKDIYKKQLRFVISAASVGMIIGAVYSYWLKRFATSPKMSKKRLSFKRPSKSQPEEGVYWTKVDEASWESFPASDPPAW